MTIRISDSMTSLARRLAPVVLITLVAAAACDDPNRFAGPGGSRPAITAIAVTPDTVADGDTVFIALSAEGPRLIQAFELQVSGAAELDTVFQVGSPAREVEGTFRIFVPENTGPDSLLYIQTVAIDVEDIRSVADDEEPPVDTVFVVDATEPVVTASATPSVVGSGETMEVRVQASDARGLAVVGFTASSPLGWDTVVADTLSPPVQTYDETLTMVAPDLDLTTLEISGFALDLNDIMGQAEPQNISLTDRLGPQFVSFETDPDSMIPLGKDVRVIVDLADPAGIKRVSIRAIAERGIASEGTDSIFDRFEPRVIDFPRPTEGPGLPTQYTIDPVLSTPDDTLAEPVTIIVVAEDSLGNTSRLEKDMYIGGPDVRLSFPPEEFEVGFGVDFEVRITIDDSRGLDSAKLFLTGLVDQTIPLALPARTDTPFLLVQSVTMPSQEGQVNIQARAWNTDEIGGLSKTSVVSILSTAPTDEMPPVVSLQAEMLVDQASRPRMEMTDEIRITVSAYDASAGLGRIGFKAIAARAGVQHEITESTPYAGTKSLRQHVFQVPIDSLYALFGITGDATLDALLPEDIELRIHGFAADTIGNVACAVGFEEQRPCTPGGYSSTEFYEAADTAGLQMQIDAVRGYTVLLENREAKIADLAIDTIDDRLFLSNISDNLVELLDMDTDPRQSQFLSQVQVGAQPWGLFIGDRVARSEEPTLPGITAGDTARTLIVGNSGGTNMSLVHLDPTASVVQEVDVIRLRTPNSLLYEVLANRDEAGNVQYQITWRDFSDRPQFLAQDSLLRIIYSTVGTTFAPGTTIRYAHPDPDPTKTTDQAEARFFLTNDMVDADASGILALANIDSLDVAEYANFSDSIQVFVHKPGHPDSILASGWHAELSLAVASVTAQIDATMAAWGVPERAALFYPVLMRGSWQLERPIDGGGSSVTLSDTTFVTASGDRGRVVIGEGAADPTGRIIMWTATENAVVSDETQIADLMNNASEQVLGVGLNWDGSLGVARGAAQTYFFTPDLRLQGLYDNASTGGAGATFHPDHDSPFDGGHTDAGGAGAAFTGTPRQSIEVVNTFHFNRITELFIRDNVVGPLKAGPPLASDNGGLGRSCAAVADPDDCVVAKLYGITSAGGVVIVNVRRRDLQ